MKQIIPGQRWISMSESELGLGIITESDQQRVSVLYPACGEKRIYSKTNAPLTRVNFEVGDTIENHEKQQMRVELIEEQDGLLIYKGIDAHNRRFQIDELDLNDHLQFNKPEHRLFSGRIDPGSSFDLRYQTWCNQQCIKQSEVKGLLGARTSLIAHQLYIANATSKRFAPRVMLADEVGLGKTIEAGLIIHQRMHQQLSQRILIIVPESLLHQWLVEMLRRFNMHFSIFDETRCLEIPDANPFNTEQLILCSAGFFTENPHRQADALEVEWDLLVVDEAHHLEWNNGQPGADYLFVQKLAENTPGLLLLTATPEQLGKESHFARLQLLDPERFYDYETFVSEQNDFEPLAKAARLLSAKQKLPDTLISQLKNRLKQDNIDGLLQSVGSMNASNDEINELLNILIDHHGTGRVLFRNSRHTVKGFPKRELKSYKLNASRSGSKKFTFDQALYIWLLDLLAELKDKKILLICKQAETALTLQHVLKTESPYRAAIFHEGMSIVERDRAAAYFADPESRAQVLICSEIGSEGRNFQFSHHLVLFDLPENPDLLQQRIGRLDRIGQRHTIQIHVPYIEHSWEHILYRWYHEGLDCFESNNDAAQQIYQLQKHQLNNLQHNFNQSSLDSLILETKTLSEKLVQALHQGKDVLLELNSCRANVAMQLINQINTLEQNYPVWPYMEKILDCFGVDSEYHSTDSHIITPGNHMRVDHFPELPEQGVTITVSREIALVREDWQFLSWEHPMVTAAMDMIISSEFGNAAVSMIKHNDFPAGKFFLQALFIVECSAPAYLQITRFLPTLPLSVVIDQHGFEQSEKIKLGQIFDVGQKLKITQLSQFFSEQRAFINGLLGKAKQSAQNKLPDLLRQCNEAYQTQQNKEIQRLTQLQKLNPSIKNTEIEHLLYNAELARGYIASTHLKLDAVRFLVSA